ncbi:universal stress protein [Sphingobium baderi]|uniref:UspA domain-containing protein n=1 Tax=Sphingobium baderi LL03 TaxID=1114964 RepID=T0GVI6_9SPHN|nr:universal stress protein [Sphingobium baderi]EQB04692.1 hypothetical protein L485_03600 [Sphingobium baderi LL03]KMS51283.1 hypothetical protein V475_22510 [Sphingobium baderi LL03]
MRDILLQANSHPEPTPDWALDRMAELAARLGAKIGIGVCKVHISPLSNWLANSLLDVDGIIAGENRKSADNADALVTAFASRMPATHRGEAFLINCPGTVTHWQFAVRARTHDLSVVPVYGHRGSVAVAEGLIFESGRPVLLLPHVQALNPERIAIAWDGSRVAARALADALPLVRLAKAVFIVQITGEKDLTQAAAAQDAIAHLAHHGIKAQAIDVPLEGQDAAASLQAYCERNGHDLLVMGAFGHSRVREFVLGGVTRSILDGPRLPVFISH